MSREIFKMYDTLGIKRTEILNLAVIKKAYKKAVAKWHPDLHEADPLEARGKFDDIQWAYNELLFMIKMNNGELPGEVLNAKAFFKAMGYDELAETTAQNLVEINLERASSSVASCDQGTISFIDAKLMRKLMLWARGLEFNTKIRILDTEGHFTPAAVKNILETAVHYETATTIEKRRELNSIFDFFTGRDSDEKYYEEDPTEVRMGQIIRSWIEEEYTFVRNHGHLHKSRVKYLVAATKSAVKKSLNAIGADKINTNKIMLQLEKGDFEEASVAIKSLIGSLDSVKTSESAIKKAVAGKNSAQKELKSIIKRVGASSIDDLRIQAISEEVSNPRLALLKERTLTLLQVADDADAFLMAADREKIKAKSALTKLANDLSDLALG